MKNRNDSPAPEGCTRRLVRGSGVDVARLNLAHRRRMRLLTEAAEKDPKLARAIRDADRVFIFDGLRLILSPEIRPAVPSEVCKEFDSQIPSSNPHRRSRHES